MNYNGGGNSGGYNGNNSGYNGNNRGYRDRRSGQNSYQPYHKYQRVNEADVPESRHSVFVRGLPASITKEELQAFLEDRFGPMTYDFFKTKPDGRNIVAACRFDDKEHAKTFIERYSEILGYKVELSWFRDIRRYLQQYGELRNNGYHRDRHERRTSDYHSREDYERRTRRRTKSRSRSRSYSRSHSRSSSRSRRSRSRDSRSRSRSESPRRKRSRSPSMLEEVKKNSMEKATPMSATPSVERDLEPVSPILKKEATHSPARTEESHDNKEIFSRPISSEGFVADSPRSVTEEEERRQRKKKEKKEKKKKDKKKRVARSSSPEDGESAEKRSRRQSPSKEVRRERRSPSMDANGDANISSMSKVFDFTPIVAAPKPSIPIQISTTVGGYDVVEKAKALAIAENERSTQEMASTTMVSHPDPITFTPIAATPVQATPVMATPTAVGVTPSASVEDVSEEQIFATNVHKFRRSLIETSTYLLPPSEKKKKHTIGGKEQEQRMREAKANLLSPFLRKRYQSRVKEIVEDCKDNMKHVASVTNMLIEADPELHERAKAAMLDVLVQIEEDSLHQMEVYVDELLSI
ncbi:hypothetical protein L596_020315 [Steinernema carpocapsae]|uniref:RRM domain-containing protein n=1 Tax=Steinernema carpocapsae TaxID=34508 RepID=A0A4U5MTT7_STECR|nr:hypothetical protein L596_020315 [Steinernema carpocapsae]